MKPTSPAANAESATKDLQLMTKRFSLGIDLGTTNCAIALTDLESDQTEVLEVTQILGPNRIGERPTLPSALYIPHRDEFPENSFPLPWENETGDASDNRPFCARAWGACSRSPRHLRQIVALQCAYRPSATIPSMGIGYPGGQAVAVRVLAAIPCPPEERVSCMLDACKGGTGIFLKLKWF